MRKNKQIKFPINWKPYPFQVPLWQYLIKGGKRAVAIWHRRAGKDVLGINWITASALTKPGTYWYVFPTYNQAERSIWDGVTLSNNSSYLSYIPENLIELKQPKKYRIQLINGSILQFIGSDRSGDCLRGSGISGAVLSEYSFQNPKIMSVIIPMIRRSNGWLLYLYTPSDDPKKTHGRILYNEAKIDPDSFCDLKTVEETTDHEGNSLYPLDKLRSDGLPEEEVQREYYCNFDAYKYKKVSDGFIFSKALKVAEREKRIKRINYDPQHVVNTYWDIGLQDYTTIWFVQEIGGKVHVIDFYANRDKVISYYFYKLKDKPYKYANIVFPHDQNRRNIIGTSSWVEANKIAAKLNLPAISVGQKMQRDDLVHIAINFLLSSNCLIDEINCEQGLQGLHNYDYSKRKTHSASNFAADAADSFCYMANSVNLKNYNLSTNSIANPTNSNALIKRGLIRFSTNL